MRKTKVDMSRLCTAIRISRKQLETQRLARFNAVKRYAGDQYSAETVDDVRPINFLSLYLQLLSRGLISQSPAATLSTFKKEYRRVVQVFQGACNTELERMQFGDTIQRAGVDAIYCMGIVKVGLASPGESEKVGWTQEVGQPYASVVDLDDWAMDPHARTLNTLSWCGHRVRVPVESLKNSKLYEEAKRMKLKPNIDRQYNQAGDERISMLGRTYTTYEQSEAYDFVDVWEIYLPMEKKIITLLSEDGGEPMSGEEGVFHEQDWVGPETGPYHFLELMPPVSGNAIPKGPIQDLIDMDEALNIMFRKLIRQGVRQKSILMVAGQSGEDAQRINDASDGETIRVDNPDKIKPAAFGGPDQNNHAFVLGLWEFLNKMGGNIELMGGLGQQSKTATQDKMLNANAGASIRWMQQAVVKFTANVIKSLCWFWHYHPRNVMTNYMPITGLSAPIEQKVTPQERWQVPFEEISVKVEPYTMQYQSPEEKLNFLNSTVTQILMPMMPLLQQNGISIDIAEYLRLVSVYGNSPDLAAIISSVEVTEGDGPQSERDMALKPASTTRTYNRVNASEATSGGQSKAMQQALLGQDAGGSQGATIGE